MADQTDENAITNALRKVLKKERQKVYFLAGTAKRIWLTPSRRVPGR